MTPEASSVQILCEKFTECGKVYKSRARMLTHMKNVHKDISNELSLLSSPVRLALFRIREEGENEEEERTQGNSRGEINSPKVVSKGRFVCNVCDQEFISKEETMRHIAEVHNTDQAESTRVELSHDNTADFEGIEDDGNDQDLWDALEAVSQKLSEPETKTPNEDILRKLERFQVLAKKKTKIQKETSEEITKLREIEENQMKDIEKKDKDIARLKKDATKEKGKTQNDLRTMQSNNNTLVKENSNLKKKLQEKEKYIQSLEEQQRPDQEENHDTTEIEEVAPINIRISGHECTACNTRYETNEYLENHIKNKHTESDCPFCDKTFESNSQLKSHVNNCIQNGTAIVKCNKCKQAFTRFGLKRHINECHKKEVHKCKECGMLANTSADIKNHMNKEHHVSNEKSREVCYHYRNGFCFRGESCRFSHVGNQRKITSESTSNKSTSNNWTPACNKGDGCQWLARGACSFFHKGVGVQKPRQGTNQTSGRKNSPNQFSPNSMSGFPPLRRGNQQTRRNRH